MASRSIGVAIGVPEPWAADLVGHRERLGDPVARKVPPHVTLLPPTTVPEASLGAVEEHLLAVASSEQGFEIHLRGTGTFRPVSPVVFLQLATGVPMCERLERRVRSGPLARETTFPYHPHVTLAQEVPAEALDRGYAELAQWEASFWVWGFTMFERGSDGVWRPQRDFAFQGAAPGSSGAG